MEAIALNWVERMGSMEHIPTLPVWLRPEARPFFVDATTRLESNHEFRTPSEKWPQVTEFSAMSVPQLTFSPLLVKSSLGWLRCKSSAWSTDISR